MTNKFIDFINKLLTNKNFYCKVVLNIENSKIVNMKVERNLQEKDLE